jgi:hypothetical protein
VAVGRHKLLPQRVPVLLGHAALGYAEQHKQPQHRRHVRAAPHQLLQDTAGSTQCMFDWVGGVGGWEGAQGAGCLAAEGCIAWSLGENAGWRLRITRHGCTWQKSAHDTKLGSTLCILASAPLCPMPNDTSATRYLKRLEVRCEAAVRPPDHKTLDPFARRVYCTCPPNKYGAGALHPPLRPALVE